MSAEAQEAHTLEHIPHLLLVRLGFPDAVSPTKPRAGNRTSSGSSGNPSFRMTSGAFIRTMPLFHHKIPTEIQ